MSRPAPRSLRLGLALLAGLGYAGCAVSSNDAVVTRPRSSDNGGAEGGAGGDSSDSLPDTGTTAGKGGMGTINTEPSPAGAGGLPDDVCAADLYKAQQVPLDMYILLDVSPSMLDATSSFDALGNSVSKWSAIKTALEAFISADASSGLGVGIQFFPLLKPNIPSVCETDADCGAAAPCAKSFCQTTGDACASQADCPGPPTANACAPFYTCGNFQCFMPGAPCVNNGITCGIPQTSFCAHAIRCDVEPYAEPAVAIAPLPDVGPDIVSAIEGQIIVAKAKLNTPTGPALSGAIQQATSWAKAHPNRRAVVVLATDGLPTECAPSSIADVAAVATKAFGSTPSINTFTIGVFQTSEAAAGKNALDKIAVGGGTKGAFVVDTSGDVVSQFQASLETVRNVHLACEFEIPQPSAARNVDYSLVNVNFKTGKKTSTVLYVGGVKNCDVLTGGWYYDTDPAVGDPSRIEICPTTCSGFQAAGSASVQIAVGCQTIVK